MPLGRPPIDVYQRIMRNITKTPKDCWEWNGFKNEAGYGMIWLDGKQSRVHRIVLSRKLDRPLTDIEVTRHICNNPPCCNPDHLQVGTTQDNIRDMVSVNRHASGEKNGQSKLTDKQIIEIRELYGSYSLRDLGKMFDVHYVHIARIVSNKSRKLVLSS